MSLLSRSGDKPVEMPALLSYRNEVVSVGLTNGTTVVSGSLANLATRQLANGVVLGGGDAEGRWLNISVRQPDWGAFDPGPVKSFVGRQAMRMFALLGVNLPEVVFAPYPSIPPRIRLYAARYTGSVEVWDLIADEVIMSPYRDTGTDGPTGLVNLFVTFAEPPLHPPVTGLGNPAPFQRYRLNISLARGSTIVDPQIGKIWIGNAVLFKHSIEARWSFGTFDPGVVDVSSGGQVYDTPGQMLKTLSCSVGGSGIDLGVAFGLGLTPATTPERIQVAPGNLSEASRIVGSTQPCILAPFSVDPRPPYNPNTLGRSLAMIRNMAIYGRCMNGIQIEHESGTPIESKAGFRCNFNMREER